MADDTASEIADRKRRATVRTMEDRERDADLRDRLEATDWGDATAKLVAAVHRMLGRKSLAEAKDIAQDAIVQVLDPDYKDWDPSANELLDHLASVAWGIVHNRRRTAKTRATVPLPDPEERRVREDPRSLEQSIATREIGDAVFLALRERFREKPLERAIVELFAEGIDLPRDQVSRVGEPYMTVYRARGRVMDEARRVLAQLEEDA